MDILDPVVYGTLWVKKLPIELPVASEVGNGVLALEHLSALTFDCPLLTQLKPRKARAFARKYHALMERDIISYGFIGALKHWSKLGDVFLRSFNWDQGTILTYEYSFELEASPIYLAMLALQKLSPDDEGLFFPLLNWCYTWHVFLAKMPLSRPDLVDPAKIAWIQRQRDVIDINAISYSYVEALRKTLVYLYDYDFPAERLGKHGPGSTASGWKLIPEKEDNYLPSRQSSQIVRHLMHNGSIYPLGTDRPLCAVWQDVPKDCKSVRPITKESVSMQHAQQALKRHMYYYTDEKLVYAGLFTRYSDQEPSRLLALYGSGPGDHDLLPITVDLQAASDRLGCELVASVLPSQIVHELMCARTWEVRVDDLLVEVSMYAGMGSATTFPVQTLVFMGIAIMSVCIALYKREYGSLPKMGTELDYLLNDGLLEGSFDLREVIAEYLVQDLTSSVNWKHLRNIRIYGDDIIVPGFAAEELLKLLSIFGLVVNVEKSFMGDSAVREACGMFACAGHDITPVRYRIPIFSGKADYAIYEAVRSLANSAFISTHCTLYRKAFRTYKVLEPFMSGSDARKSRYYQNIGSGKIEVARINTLSILCEDYRGDVDYTGLISLRPMEACQRAIVFGELHDAVKALRGDLQSKFVETTEIYHYHQALYLAWRDDILVEAHGRIPRGIRMKPRIAYEQSHKLGWAWAPSVIA